MYQTYFKRFIDFLFTSISIIALSPVLLSVAIMVRYNLGSPVLFKQFRPGLHGQPFIIYKFRTMIDASDNKGKFLVDEVRLTPFGRFLRALSLDELPALWNIIKGDMSLVGPRPLLMQYLDRYTPSQARRHKVKPGLTGWAQVNGRNAISWEEKFKLDVWYVDNHTFLLDVMIILLTVKKVMMREGISADGEATMMEFMGNKRGDE